eukprot:6915018-Alexandrium_andersonii.AAC.1
MSKAEWPPPCQARPKLPETARNGQTCVFGHFPARSVAFRRVRALSGVFGRSPNLPESDRRRLK